MIVKVNVLLCFFVIFAGLEVFAQESEAEETPNQAWEQSLIDDNQAIGQWFDSMAEGLDLFLAGRSVTRHKNETRVVLENSSFEKEGEGFKNTSNINAHLRLPNVEEYWQLKFASYDEAEDQRGVQNGYLRQTPRDRNYGATVGFFRRFGRIRTSFQPRVDFGDPLKISQSLAFESVAEMSNFTINPKFEFFANPSQGIGNFLALNFHFPLTLEWSLTLINNATYLEKTHLFSASNGFSIGQSISDRTSFSYNWLFFSNNLTSYHLDSYTLSFVWSQVLYKNILDMQLIPHVDFEKADSFRGRAGAIFNLSLSF